MGTEDSTVEIESLETGLLSACNGEDDETRVLYTASFGDMEENFVKYQTAQWVLYSLVLILAWGIGVFMLIYLPLRRYILRRDFQSRKLFVTPNAIVYKVTRPVVFPCFGVLVKEKHVLLPSVADIVVEQGCPSKFCSMWLCISVGYLQSLFGVYSVRIENGGVRRPRSDDLQIEGIANASAFRKAVLTHLANIKKTDGFSRQFSLVEDTLTLRAGHSALMSPSKSIIQDTVAPDELILLQKLEEVGSSIKRVQTLIEEQKSQTSECVD